MEFKPASIIENESNRLKAVERTGAMYNEAHDLYEIYCYLAKEITSCPVSWTGLIDDKFQYCLASSGLPEDMSKEIPREQTFCQFALNSKQPLIISDMSKDNRFKFHPTVKEKLVKFYAGFPIFTNDGYVLGTLCVSDSRVRRLTNNKINVLKKLAEKLAYQLEIQHNFQSKNAETLLEVLEKITSKFSSISTENVKIILKYFSNQIIDKKYYKFLISNKICFIENGTLKITKLGNDLKNNLSLNIGILKRMNNLSANDAALDKLFMQIKKK